MFFQFYALVIFQNRAKFFKNSYKNSIGKAAESSVHILATGVNKRTKLVHFLLQKIRRPINFNLFYENIISNTIPVWTYFSSKITTMNVTSTWTRENTKIEKNSRGIYQNQYKPKNKSRTKNWTRFLHSK